MDIHEYVPGTYMVLEGSSPIIRFDPKTGVAEGKPVALYVENLEDLDNPKAKNVDMTITTMITRRIKDSNAAGSGEALYTPLECEGEQNLFALCRKYLAEIDRFFEYGVKQGFIT